MISKDKLVPSLRFKEFTHAWEQDSLQQLVDKIKSDLKITDVNEKGIYDIYGIDGKIGKGFPKKIFDFDIITISKDGSVGKIQILPKNTGFTSTLEGIFITKKEKMINYFLYLIFSKIPFDEFIVGSTIPHLYFNDYKFLNIKFPTLDEQRKIANLFTSVDSLISLHKRKYNFLKNIKNTLLDKMFPSQNSNIPSIRFKEFTHAWEQDNLGNLVSIQNGKLNANSMENNGKYNFYTSGKEIFKINSWSFEGDAVTIAGNGASMGFIHRAKGKFDAYQRTYVLKTEKLNIDFLYFNLWNNLWNDVQKKISNGGIPFIVYDDINLFPFKTPSYNEQTKIANLFTHLDSLLSLHKRKLTALENIKAKLLERMFI
ncbi:restriction endonuclease subunit S [Mycoplasma sp. CB776]